MSSDIPGDIFAHGSPSHPCSASSAEEDEPGHLSVFDLDFDDDHQDDIRYSYAARWNISSRPIPPGSGLRFRPRLSDRADSTYGRREVPRQNAWLPLLPLPQEPRDDDAYRKVSATRKIPKGGLVGKHGEPLGVFRVRARDFRVVGQFLVSPVSSRRVPSCDLTMTMFGFVGPTPPRV